jgi:hypothetical protein
MNRYNFPFVFLLIIFIRTGLYGIVPNNFESVLFNMNGQDTLKGNQILYNGILWRNLYYKVREDQFLFSNELLPGSLTINGKTFINISLRYDIYNDEIMILKNPGEIIQLNKEMVDSFSLIFKNKTYKFVKIRENTARGFNGYVNVLYKGRNALYVKYKKEIEPLAVDHKYDQFYLTKRIYLVKDSIVYTITGKSALYKILNEDKTQIRNYIKKNKLRVSKQIPGSFIPVIAYCDSISK